MEERARGWRHDLHRIPETAFGEHQTSAYVAGVLGGLGFEVATGIGGTGVVGSLTRGSSARAVGLRSELDALHQSAKPDHRHLSVVRWGSSAAGAVPVSSNARA
jgi:hippurate hydrolase